MCLMPIVEISLLEGRTPGAKEALIAGVTDAIVTALDAPRETVRVILREMGPEHFGVGGVSKAKSVRNQEVLTCRSHM
jgi:4-oxalocrotonate tautomerase